MVLGSQPPARHGPVLGPAPAPPRGTRRMSETGAGMRRSEGAGARGLRAAASLPQLARGRGEEGGGRRSPCLLVALRPRNVEAERERFFRASFAYDPQFEYAEPPPAAVLEKYGEASDRFVAQAIRIIQAVLEKYGTYESFEVATGGRLLSKCQIWSVIRKYMQKEGCVGEAAAPQLLQRDPSWAAAPQPLHLPGPSGAAPGAPPWLQGTGLPSDHGMEREISSGTFSLSFLTALGLSALRHCSALLLSHLPLSSACSHPPCIYLPFLALIIPEPKIFLFPAGLRQVPAPWSRQSHSHSFHEPPLGRGPLPCYQNRHRIDPEHSSPLPIIFKNWF